MKRIEFVALILLTGLSIASCVSPSAGAKTDPKSMDRLLARIKTYHDLFLEKNYASAFDLIAGKWRLNDDRVKWAASVERIAEKIKLVNYSATGICICGDLARVVVALHIQGEASAARETEYWQFENNDWFFVPVQLRDIGDPCDCKASSVQSSTEPD